MSDEFHNDLAVERRDERREPDPLDRTVRELVCAECGTPRDEIPDTPFVVEEETEVCLTCYLAVGS